MMASASCSDAVWPSCSFRGLMTVLNSRRWLQLRQRRLHGRAGLRLFRTHLLEPVEQPMVHYIGAHPRPRQWLDARTSSGVVIEVGPSASSVGHHHGEGAVACAVNLLVDQGHAAVVARAIHPPVAATPRGVRLEMRLEVALYVRRPEKRERKAYKQEMRWLASGN